MHGYKHIKHNLSPKNEQVHVTTKFNSIMWINMKDSKHLSSCIG